MGVLNKLSKYRKWSKFRGTRKAGKRAEVAERRASEAEYEARKTALATKDITKRLALKELAREEKMEGLEKRIEELSLSKRRPEMPAPRIPRRIERSLERISEKERRIITPRTQMGKMEKARVDADNIAYKRAVKLPLTIKEERQERQLVRHGWRPFLEKRFWYHKSH